MIEVKNISKQYKLSKKQQKEQKINTKSLCAVKDISFTCKPGRIFSLLGPNGAGKTTLLRMIATIFNPSTGQIFVNGHNTVNEPIKVKSNIGFLTGSTNLYERLTPEETVKYFADLHQMNKKKYNAQKELLFEKLGINEFSKKRIGQLSTGMKQKVSIARSMIHDPNVVIFDEPSSGLDIITANEIISLIKTCKKQNKTVVFSTHIMSEVDLLSDDLVVIHKGNILYNNTLDEFKRSSSNKSLTEAFINLVTQSNITDT